MSINAKITDHYSHRGNHATNIIAQARARAADPDNLTIDDLCRFDEMHVGGFYATRHFIPLLGFAAGMNILDIGSGIGGPARYTAATYGAHVTGIDLTPPYKQTAIALSKAVNLSTQTKFLTASAVSLPFKNAEFDAAYTMHVGMNIADKAAFYSEAARVLKNGATFGIYDTFLVAGDKPLAYPLPWAQTKESSFLLTLDELHGHLNQAGFEIIDTDTENRRAFAIDRLTRLKESGDDKLGVALDNLLGQIHSDALCPYEVICRKRPIQHGE